MTALQVYAILNKRVRGLISGVKSAVVNGTTITFIMNDGTKVPMTFPTPKDGVSVTNIEIKEIANSNKKHLIFTMSDGNIIDSGELEGSGGGIIQKDNKEMFPNTGEDSALYLAKDTGTLFYWNGQKYEEIVSDSSPSLSELGTSTIEFDGVNDTFELPIDGISYNVFVNGVYYTEGIDYIIDRNTSPNTITFEDIYEDYELCTLTYLKTVGAVPGENINLDFATKDDIDAMFA